MGNTEVHEQSSSLHRRGKVASVCLVHGPFKHHFCQRWAGEGDALRDVPSTPPRCHIPAYLSFLLPPAKLSPSRAFSSMQYLSALLFLAHAPLCLGVYQSLSVNSISGSICYLQYLAKHLSLCCPLSLCQISFSADCLSIVHLYLHRLVTNPWAHGTSWGTL